MSAAEYDLRERPNREGDDKQQPLYPRIVPKRTISTRELAEKIHQQSTYTVGEIEGILGILSDEITRYVTEGYNVELRRLGYFSGSLKARPVMEKSEIRSYSIEFDTVNFRASSELKRNLRGKTLVRAKDGFLKSKKLPIEERRALLEKYLEEHPFITRIKYSALTGLLTRLALADLNGWVKEGWLASMGKSSTKVFLISEKRKVNREE